MSHIGQERERLFKRGRIFYIKKARSRLTDFDDFELMYGISKQQVVIELFRINGGKLGYYLANLRNKKYYYCGIEVQDVKAKQLNLGIGRADPVE